VELGVPSLSEARFSRVPRDNICCQKLQLISVATVSQVMNVARVESSLISAIADAPLAHRNHSFIR
jgi:hypothetical protein